MTEQPTKSMDIWQAYAAAQDEYQRCMDMLGDVPGTTLEQRLTHYIGSYMALQIAASPGVRAAVIEALKPFIRTGWMTSDTEHTNRTVIAHMHPEKEREIVLSSDDFYRAAKAYAALSQAPVTDGEK